MEKIKIIFMGTPPFAVTILDKIVNTPNIEVMATVTAPDKPAGRGRKLNQSAVKQYAQKNNLTCLQPSNLKDPQFISTLKEHKAALFVVVAFRMLPEVVWNMPPMGTINLHGSLLPQYRGAAPINWAVINGDAETGVTTFFIEKEIDTGLIIERESIPIKENETAGEIHDKLMHLGADLTVSTIQKIATGKVIRTPQESLTKEPLNKAPKIFKQDCLINFEHDIYTIHNFIRGLSPYPTAWLKLKKIKDGSIKTVKLFKARICKNTKQNTQPIFSIEEKELLLCLKDGALCIEEIQLEGKKRLKVKDFIAGFKPEDWEIVND